MLEVGLLRSCVVYRIQLTLHYVLCTECNVVYMAAKCPQGTEVGYQEAVAVLLLHGGSQGAWLLTCAAKSVVHGVGGQLYLGTVTI